MRGAVIIKGLAIALFGFGLGVVSCGSSDGGGNAACIEGAQASCDKLWDCAEGAPYREDVPDKATCVSEGTANCATPCAPGTTIKADKAKLCTDAIKASTCAEIAATDGDSLFPAVCLMACG